MTEDEARKKWCPMVRQLGTLRQPAQPGEQDYVVATGSQNRGFAMGVPLDALCIASDCMMWRWEETPHYMQDSAKMPLQGHCGLAGTPND